jgi:EPS-associated MarR family transcriptional regulator
MNNIDSGDELDILRKISNSKANTQRELAKISGMSLGKFNYCINALKKRGYVKYQNFKFSKNKIGYFYILTPKGVTHKTKLIISFMKKKMLEYEELKKEMKK